MPIVIFTFNRITKGDHTSMLIQTSNPKGFGFEMEITPTTFFLRIPKVCEITRTHGFGWTFKPRRELLRLEESWRQRREVFMMELQE